MVKSLNPQELSKIINQNSKAILNEIHEDFLIRYLYLKEAYRNTNVEENEKFRKAFSYYYVMRFVTQDFRNEFFKIMQEEKKVAYPNFQDISQQLYTVCGTHQFSFITKLLNIRFDEHPIYDRFVDTAFGFKRSAIAFEDKVSQDREIVEYMSNVYSTIQQNNLIESTIDQFDRKFANYQIPFVKKIDFFVWAVGKENMY